MNEQFENPGSGFGLKEVLLLILIIMPIALVVIPQYIDDNRNRPGKYRIGCINNLRQIDAAINEWALENKKTNGTPVTENDITGYIKLNSAGKIPGCPAGGKYTFGKVGDVPQISCSFSTATPAHALP